MDATMLAYCAGIIDADGYIGIKRSTYSMRKIKDCSQPTFSERVAVKQVESAAVNLLHSLFGGYRGRQRATAKRGKSLEVWQVTDKKAYEFLKTIRPYLRIKATQADNCIHLRELKETSKAARVSFGRGHVGSARRSPEMSAAMESLYARGKELNRVGV